MEDVRKNWPVYLLLGAILFALMFLHSTAHASEPIRGYQWGKCSELKDRWMELKKNVQPSVIIGYHVDFLRGELKMCDMHAEDVGETELKLMDYRAKYVLYAAEKKVKADEERKARELKMKKAPKKENPPAKKTPANYHKKEGALA